MVYFCHKYFTTILLNVWGYFSVAATGGLHEFADSQFGHCFSWGENREEAISLVSPSLLPFLRPLPLRNQKLLACGFRCRAVQGMKSRPYLKHLMPESKNTICPLSSFETCDDMHGISSPRSLILSLLQVELEGDPKNVQGD